MGIILYELVVGRPPFDGGNHVQLLRNIERNEARIPDQVAAQLSRCCAGLIHQLLKRNPVERISFEVGARVRRHCALLVTVIQDSENNTYAMVLTAMI